MVNIVHLDLDWKQTPLDEIQMDLQIKKWSVFIVVFYLLLPLATIYNN